MNKSIRAHAAKGSGCWLAVMDNTSLNNVWRSRLCQRSGRPLFPYLNSEPRVCVPTTEASQYSSSLGKFTQGYWKGGFFLVSNLIQTIRISSRLSSRKTLKKAASGKQWPHKWKFRASGDHHGQTTLHIWNKEIKTRQLLATNNVVAADIRPLLLSKLN